jgi:hypothetical protein
MGSINKTSYDNLTIILKAGLPYINKVNLKRPLDLINKAPHPIRIFVDFLETYEWAQ